MKPSEQRGRSMKGGRCPAAVAVVAALGALSACVGEEGLPAGQAVEWDSAGVTVVESTGSTWRPGEEWLISDEPLLQVGSLDGPEGYSFGFVTDAVLLSDKRLVVLDQMAAALRVFDRQGRVIEDWARKGDGPGELGRPREIVRLPGDSILVEEFGGVGSVFDSRGHFVRRFRLPVEEWSMGDFSHEVFNSSWYGLVDRLADGSYLTQLRAWIDRDPGRHPERIGLARLTEEGSGDTIIVVTAGRYGVESDGRGISIVGTHFDPQVLATAYAGQVYVSDGSAFSYRIYSADGDLAKVVRLLWPRTAVDQEVKARWRENRSQYWGQSPEPGVPQGRLQELFDRTAYPDSLPSFYALRVDSQGFVWGEGVPSREFSSPSPDQFVFAPSGAFLGVVRAPQGFRITEIGGTYLVGVWRDENEVDYVRVYELSRAH
ncbi:MAG: 6-bladed beta-propeller [Longimicrobiales bacterium]